MTILSKEKEKMRVMWRWKHRVSCGDEFLKSEKECEKYNDLFFFILFSCSNLQCGWWKVIGKPVVIE